MSPRGGLRDRLARLRGSSVLLDLGRYDAALAAIGRLVRSSRPSAMPELRAAPGACATPRRPASRWRRSRSEPSRWRARSRHVLGMRPFDEQVVAALALDEGAVVEMQTGEGKTLAAVMPGGLNALAGRGVHVLTFNDYLARRDAEWMGPIYRALGLSVGWVDGGHAARGAAAGLSPPT